MAEFRSSSDHIIVHDLVLNHAHTSEVSFYKHVHIHTHSGYYGIKQDECERKGCCWDESVEVSENICMICPVCHTTDNTFKLSLCSYVGCSLVLL